MVVSKWKTITKSFLFELDSRKKVSVSEPKIAAMDLKLVLVMISAVYLSNVLAYRGCNYNRFFGKVLDFEKYITHFDPNFLR